MGNIHVLAGQGQRAEDRAGEMYELIMELIAENGDGMALATVLGVLELVRDGVIAKELEKLP